MNLSYLSTSRAAETHNVDATANVAAARVNWILQAINNPSRQSPDVAQAIAILTEAAPGTGTTTFGRSVTSSAATSGRFENVVELITGVLQDLEEEGTDYLFSAPLPHFVPTGWSEYLQVSAIEDPDFELPWLADLD